MTRTSSSAFAEIRENEAPRETAGLYDDLRRETGLPVVNLIYRHFAALPGVLPWVWGLLGPALRSGQVDEALQRIGATLRFPAPRGLSAALSGLDDLGDADRQDIAAILDVYNRGNLLNLINLNAVRIVLDRRGRAETDAPARKPAGQRKRVPLGPIRPLPKLDDLSGRTGALVRSLAGLHSAGNGVIPSLYLHLAHWPSLLAAAQGPIREMVADGELERIRSDLQLSAVEEATGLAQGMTPDRPAPTGQMEPLRRALDIFAGHLIGEMAVIGHALRRSLPSNEAPASGNP